MSIHFGNKVFNSESGPAYCVTRLLLQVCVYVCVCIKFMLSHNNANQSFAFKICLVLLTFILSFRSYMRTRSKMVTFNNATTLQRKLWPKFTLPFFLTGCGKTLLQVNYLDSFLSVLSKKPRQHVFVCIVCPRLFWIFPIDFVHLELA